LIKGSLCRLKIEIEGGLCCGCSSILREKSSLRTLRESALKEIAAGIHDY